ncbi:GerAB/ArcD/ProY family transporter [Alicyclobacillus fodiniaquatilis]|uniref:Endospore germination permease n=1 Tax=Alicyclobacillus fodiniaquatilis TaxID=1661150 RepID=A0ABW4JE32_9BACL
MEHSKDTITMTQLTMIMMLAIGLNNHVILIPLLLCVAGRDAWFSVCLTSLFALMLMGVMQYIIRVSKQHHLGSWLRAQTRPMFANMLLCLVALPLFVTAVVTLRDTVSWAEISILPTTPSIVLVVALAAVCCYMAYAGITSIAIISGLLLPLVVLLGFFVGASNLPHKDAPSLFPLFEHGWHPVFAGALYVSSGFSELIALLFVQHCVKTNIRYWMLALNVLILAGLTLGPLCGAIMEFGPVEAANLRYSPFEEWRLVTFGHFVEHVDFMAIYQWLSGAFVRISFALFLVIEIFGIHRQQKRVWYLMSLCGVVCALSLFPLSNMAFFYLLKRWIVPGTLYSIGVVAFFLVIFAWLSKQKKV